MRRDCARVTLRPGDIPDFLVEHNYPRPALSTVYGWIERGAFKSRRIGGKIIIDVQEIEQWLTNRK